MMLPVLMAVSLLAPSAATLDIEERAILRAVMARGGDWGSKTLSRRVIDAYISEARDPVMQHEWRMIDTGEVFTFPTHLLDSLHERNRHSITMQTPRPRSKAVGFISRPGISSDGTKAIVFTQSLGDYGEPASFGFLYLEQRDGKWQVVGHGPGGEY